MISKQFFKSSIIYSVIGALPLASSIILLPFYTNLLTTSDFGILALYISFTFIVQVFANFGLSNYTGVHYVDVKDQPKKVHEYVGTIVTGLLVIGVFFTVASIIAGESFFSWVSEITFKGKAINFYPYGFMSVLTGIFNSFFRCYTTLLVYQQRPERFFWMNIINFILTIGISLAGLYMYPYTLIGPMWGRLLSGVGIFAIAFFLFQKEYGWHFKVGLLRGIFNYCYPVFIYAALVWLLGNADRFIILRYMRTEDVGIFDFAVKCTFLLDFFQNGLSSSIYPKVFSIWKDQNLRESSIAVNRYYNGFTAVSIIAVSLWLIVIPLLVPLVVKNSDFYDAFNFLGVLGLGFATRGLHYMFLGPVFYFKETKILPKVFFFSSVIQIFVSVMFIKIFGLWGAVWAFFLVKPVQVFILYLYTRKIFRFWFNKMKQIYLPLFYVILIVTGMLLPDEETRFLFGIIQFGIISSAVWIVYRREIKQVVQQAFASRFLEFLHIFRPGK